MYSKLSKQGNKKAPKICSSNMRMAEFQKRSKNLLKIIISPTLLSKINQKVRKENIEVKKSPIGAKTNRSNSPNFKKIQLMDNSKLRKPYTNSINKMNSFIKNISEKMNKYSKSPLTKAGESSATKNRVQSKSNYTTEKLDSKSLINLKREMNSFPFTKYSTNRNVEQKLQSELLMKTTFSGLQTSLMKNIFRVKTENCNTEMLLSMNKTFLDSLHEISLMVDSDLSVLLESIEGGMRQINKIISKTLKKCDCIKSANIIEELNKKLSEEKIKAYIKANDKEILEQKLRSNMCELNAVIKENEKLNQLLKEKPQKMVNEYAQTDKFVDKKSKKKSTDEEVSMLKHRENKLIYFFNLLKDKGFPIDKIYDSEVKNISTERFSEVTNGDEDMQSKELSFEEILKEVNNSKVSNYSKDEKNEKLKIQK